MANPIQPTQNLWDVLANEQSAGAMTAGNLNSTTFPTLSDPIYGKLIMQISDTIYREMRIEQRWGNLGVTAQPNEYPGILREIYMKKRKGMDYAMDQDPRPTQLDVYEIINDDIDIRYHAAQFRWMYGWTIFDQELKRYTGGFPSMIAQLTEMKAVNAASARNMYMDALRKELLFNVMQNVATTVETTIDISNFETLTAEDAKQWLIDMDNLLFELRVGTSKYNRLGEFMQTDPADLQVIIPYTYYKNVLRRAFPDTYHIEEFQGILPSNMILIDTLGGDSIGNGATPPAPTPATYDAHGMSLLNWTSTSTVIPGDESAQLVIMDKRIMGVEDNLSQTLIGARDIEKLATPVRMHYWTSAYYTDMVPAVVVKLGE